MSDIKSIFWKGFRRTLPFQSGVFPFGILYATLAVAAGFPAWLVMFISIIVFGGSSQLVFIDLFQHLSSPFQAALGANVVNARHLIYSAGVSGKFSHFKRRWKLILSYLLTDQLYAISQSAHKDLDSVQKDLQAWYYFGSGLCTWSFWMVACLLGIMFGQFVPASWNLGFSIPLMFMPLIFTVSQDKWAYVSCICAALFVFLFKSVPYGLGVFISILLASFAGYLVRKLGRRKK